MPHVPRAFTSTCHNVIQCHTMSYNVIQCHTMSYNVLSLSLALRSLGASAGTGLWTAFSNREVFIFVDDLKRQERVKYTAHWSHLVTSVLSSTYPAVFELHLSKMIRKFRTLFAYLRLSSVSLSFPLHFASCRL